jgi:PAS domain-containing protein
VASDLETMRRRLAGRMEALERLRHLSAQVVGATSLQRLAEVALAGLQPEVGATRALLGAARPVGDLHLRARAGFPDPRVADDIVKADVEIRQVLPLQRLRAGQVVGMADLDEVAGWSPVLQDLVARLGVRSLALVPLLSRGRFLGLLALCWTERHRLDREQEALLGLAGNQIAGAMEAALRLEEAERAAGEARAVFYAIADGVLLTDPFGRVTAMNRALEALTGWTEAEARGRPYAEVLPITGEQVGGPADLVSRYGRQGAGGRLLGPHLRRQGPGRGRGGRDPRRLQGARDRRGQVGPDLDRLPRAAHPPHPHPRLRRAAGAAGHAGRAPALLGGRDPGRLPPAGPADRRPPERVPDGVGPPRARPPAPGPGRGGGADPLPVPGDGRQAHLADQAPDQPAGGLGDPDKVEQILTNLVGNAIKYSPGGGEVLVTVEHDGDTVQVSVRDQGIGMSPRDMGQLFEKFYRVDREEVRSVFRFTLPTSDELAGSGR